MPVQGLGDISHLTRADPMYYSDHIQILQYGPAVGRVRMKLKTTFLDTEGASGTGTGAVDRAASSHSAHLTHFLQGSEASGNPEKDPRPRRARL